MSKDKNVPPRLYRPGDYVTVTNKKLRGGIGEGVIIRDEMSKGGETGFYHVMILSPQKFSLPVIRATTEQMEPAVKPDLSPEFLDD